MDREVAQIAAAIAEIAKALREQTEVLQRILPLLVDEDDERNLKCGKCGSFNLVNESTMGQPRLICADCRQVWEASDG